jgi:hypothetical protein
MIHSIILYLIVQTSGNVYNTTKYTNYDLYSIIPIKECSAILDINKMTGEKSVLHFCKPESLYQQMTGQGDFVIVVTGGYQI